MIINPIIQNGDGLKPQIIVTAPTGSIVTCTTPDGIVIQGIEVSGTWMFANLPGLGTYTVNAVFGSQSKAESVIIDRIGIFEITIYFILYLYNLGDECTDVTGGWSAHPGNHGTITKEETDIKGYYNYSADMHPLAVCTTNLIDLKGYSTMFVDASGTGTVNFLFGISNRYGPSWDDTWYTATGENFSNGVRETKSIDISLYNQPYRIIMLGDFAYQSSGTGYLYRVWLE